MLGMPLCLTPIVDFFPLMCTWCVLVKNTSAPFAPSRHLLQVSAAGGSTQTSLPDSEPSVENSACLHAAAGGSTQTSLPDSELSMETSACLDAAAGGSTQTSLPDTEPFNGDLSVHGCRR